MPRYDYTQLEGKTLKVAGYHNIKDAIITGCDYDIGISLQEPGTNRYILCLTSPKVFKKREKRSSKLRQQEYRKIFLILIKAFKDGYFSKDIAYQTKRIITTFKPDYGPTAENCPFT